MYDNSAIDDIKELSENLLAKVKLMQTKSALTLLDQLINTISISFRSTSCKIQRTIPRLILFDIDGTLIYSQHKLGDAPIVKAVCQAFNDSNITRNGVKFSGKTDRGIIRDLLTANNVQYDQYKVNETLKLLPNIMHKEVEIKNAVYKTQLNAIELLDSLSERTDVVCGLLTGNIHKNVDIKLGNANNNFLKYFPKLNNNYIGGFGSDDEIRSNLISFAKERYAKYLNIDINTINNNTDLIVIGDTPRDIECAHVNNVPVVAIATGRFTMEQLQKENPNGLLKDFSDINKAIDLLCNCNFLM
eukprot:214961_1